MTLQSTADLRSDETRTYPRAPTVFAAGPAAAQWRACAEYIGAPAPGVIGQASGNPVSWKAKDLSPAAALERIVALLHAGRLDELDEFDGPFLAIVHDPGTQTVRVARDKFGLRSAFYQELPDGTLIVADDIACLPGTDAIRKLAVSEWLHHGTPLAPQTFYEQVRALAAGSTLTRSGAQPAQISRWFSPENYVSASKYNENRSLTLPQATDRFLKTFEETVAACIGDSPRVTILFSGGVDSSLLTAVARNVRPVDAVTIDIQGPRAQTEVHYARDMAKAIGHSVDLTEVVFGPREFTDGLCRTVRDLGHPIIIENAIALNHTARCGGLPHGQLVLDGEGADALMAGSTPLFKYSLMIRHIGRVTGLGSERVRSLLERMRGFLDRLGLETRSTLDGRGLDADLLARRLELSELEVRLRQSFAHLPEREDQEIASLMLREFYDYLVPLMLRIDSMSSIVGSHTVLPYLTRPIFEYLQNLPMDLKVATPSRRRGPLTKAMLKAALARFVPDSMIYKPKIGFGIPGWEWISVPPAWREDLWLAECFRLPKSATNHLLDTTRNRDLIFFASLEVWGRLHARKLPFEQVEAEWIEHNERELVRRGVLPGK